MGFIKPVGGGVYDASSRLPLKGSSRVAGEGVFNTMNGILAFDKPQEISSFFACSLLRRLLGVKKIGHGGTLDPMATGVLPVLVGPATRAMDLIPAQDKEYIATMRFGYVSDTLDVWGTVRATGGTIPTKQAAEAVLERFRGDILQVPPMTSALQKDGVRLYELARKGIEIERAARPITVFALELLDFDESCGEMTVRCHCSKGTYIRSLCDDIGAALGCGAVMTALRRTVAAGIRVEDCITLDAAKQLTADELAARIRPIDTVFADYAALTVTAAQATRFANGGALSLQRLPFAPASTVRVYAPDGRFLGLGHPAEEELKVKKLF